MCKMIGTALLVWLVCGRWDFFVVDDESVD